MFAYHAILGHRRQIDQLERARRSGRVAHAYLFFGPDGVGKERVAFAFAQALNCTAEPEVPCGRCDSCRKIERGCHPDVRLVASEEELVDRGLMEAEKARTPSAQIRNVQLSELADLFRHRPYLGRWKVVMVVDADKLNVYSQNRFLKTLEEPTPDSVIILITAHPEALLPTVRSRCQALAFGPVSRREVAAFLTGKHELDEKHVQALAAMSQGSFGRAQALAQEGILELRDRLVQGLSRVLEGDLAELLEVAQEHGDDRQKLQEALDLMELWCRDLMLASLEVPTELLINQDRSVQIKKAAGRYSAQRLLGFIERIRRTRQDLKINANPRMAMESLLIAMRIH